MSVSLSAPSLSLFRAFFSTFSPRKRQITLGFLFVTRNKEFIMTLIPFLPSYKIPSSFVSMSLSHPPPSLPPLLFIHPFCFFHCPSKFLYPLIHALPSVTFENLKVQNFEISLLSLCIQYVHICSILLVLFILPNIADGQVNGMFVIWFR